MGGGRAQGRGKGNGRGREGSERGEDPPGKILATGLRRLFTH